MPKRSASGRKRFDVAIAGGGLVGRTLALALAKLSPRGFRIALIDAEPAPTERGEVEDARALALSAATKNLLSALDLWEKLAPSVQAIEAIEITDSALNAPLRPYFLGFDDELNQNGASAFMVEHGDLEPRARRSGRGRACHRHACFRPRNRLHRGSICDRGFAWQREGDHGQSSRRRRWQALTAPRARRHQMRGLVLSADRDRDHRGPCAAPSRQGGSAFPPLRTFRHPPAHRKPFLDRVDGRRR